MTATAAKFDSDEIRRALGILTCAGEVRELRSPKTAQGTVSGYFSDSEKLVQAAANLSGNVPAVYLTINPVNPALLARSDNKVKPRAENTTTDNNVIRRTWLPVDLDAKRPAGISSTDSEHEAATARAREVINYLELIGLRHESVVLADSGNGGHTLIRVDLPNDHESATLCQDCLKALDLKFSDGQVGVDLTLYNAARILKLYGTLVCKGESTPDRPHRLSRILSAPQHIVPAPRHILSTLAATVRQAPRQSERAGYGANRRIDLEKWLASYGIETRRVKSWQGAKFFELKVCPWNPDHSHGEAYAIQYDNGAIAAGCHHNSCGTYTWHDLRGKYEAKAKRRSAPIGDTVASDREPEFGLPEICITARPLKDKTTDALSAIIASNIPPRIFRHGGGLARVETTETGQPIIRQLTESGLRGELERAATWLAMTGKSATPVAPPLDVVRDLLALPGWPDIPAIQAITETPVIRPDGTILSARGYDPDTRLYYYPAPDMQIPPIPDRPTREDVDAAIALLSEVFCDFPFDNEISKANVLAVLITPIVRPLIAGPAPLCVIDKPQVGSGASLIATVIAIITTGRPAAMMTAPRDSDEWRKTITSALMQGRSVVVIDNIEGAIYDQNLACVLTSTVYAARMLGTMEMKNMPNLTTWIATGNNIRLGGDLPRRAFLVRIDPGVARPWMRDPGQFRHPELEAWCAGNRGPILAAALTLARAWIVDERPKPTETPRLGGYESWVRVIGGILAYAGIVGFLGNLMELYGRNDAETPAWAAFIERWYEILEDKAATGARLMEELGSNQDFEVVLPIDPPHRDKRTGDIDDTGFTRRLGKALAAREGRIYAGEKAEYKLSRAGELKRAQLWRVILNSPNSSNSPNFTNKSEFGECESPPNARAREGQNGTTVDINSLNSLSKANLASKSKLTQNSYGGPPEYPAEPCRSCGSTDFWLREASRWGRAEWLCSRCHPNPEGNGKQC